jgi:radical SAM superfamily enzyme YgiQ (UPF0313 family)
LKVVLISPYELGRQPFGLAEPAAWLREAGFQVRCLDLAIDRLDADAMADADLVALYVAMHTATRIAVEALPRIRALAPRAHLCAYGLYAPVNVDLFHGLGVGTVLGGESEPDLLALAEKLRDGHDVATSHAHVRLDKIPFITPDRSTLPSLDRYAHLILANGDQRVVGFAEASRGCKHLCRHCPVVPVYAGRFRIVPLEVVIADMRQQVAAGARHISFGDPDFFNGPTHARKVVEALHAEFPHITYDATIKIEHIIRSNELLGTLAETGCLFITSAVESVDDDILVHLDKGHTSEDFASAAAMLREAGIALAPTFVAFTPWTTVAGYARLLETLVDLAMVASVPPVQLAIRLLVPAGSRLLELPGFRHRLDDFDAALLGYPWKHTDPKVDALQARIQEVAETAEREQLGRRETFERIWRLAHGACDRIAPALPANVGEPIPHHSEPWYCCAEPTSQQLQSF